MPSPVRIDQHAEPDSLIQTWLGYYAIATPGVKAAINATTRLGPDDVPQPDGLLRIAVEHGGQARVDARGYLQGGPELVVEIAASTASIDMREKLVSYRRVGVREYLVWRTEDEELNWWALEDDDYKPLPASSDGAVRSRIFPGLWLDTGALLASDGVGVMAKLQEGLRTAEHLAFVEALQKRLETKGSVLGRSSNELEGQL